MAKGRYLWATTLLLELSLVQFLNHIAVKNFISAMAVVAAATEAAITATRQWRNLLRYRRQRLRVRLRWQ